MEEKIKDVYNLKEIENNKEDSLVIWFNNLINKIPTEIDAFDINRMIRQNVLLELALEKGLTILLDNPFAYELSNGDILEHILLIDKSLLLHYIEELKIIEKKAEKNINSVAWWYPEEKDEFEVLLKKLKEIIKSK